MSHELTLTVCAGEASANARPEMGQATEHIAPSLTLQVLIVQVEMGKAIENLFGGGSQSQHDPGGARR